MPTAHSLRLYYWKCSPQNGCQSANGYLPVHHKISTKGKSKTYRAIWYCCNIQVRDHCTGIVEQGRNQRSKSMTGWTFKKIQNKNLVLCLRKLVKYCFRMSFNEGMLVTSSSFLFYLHVWKIVARAMNFYIDSNCL